MPSRAYQMADLFSRIGLIVRAGSWRGCICDCCSAGYLSPGKAARQAWRRHESLHARAVEGSRSRRNPDALQRAQRPILGFAERFLTGLESLRSFRNVLMIFFTSVLIWLLETVKYWFVMQAFPFDVSFFALMLMNGVVNLATTLPSAPGYVGTFDLPGIKILNELYKVPAGDGDGLYTGVARGAVAAHHTAGRLLHVARRVALVGL